MNQLVTAMQKQANKTETLNGAKAYKSTKNAILDLFSSWGGMRGKDITPLLRNAINDDPILSLRCLLWGRDIRGGAGERELFRMALLFLSKHNNLVSNLYLQRIPDVGRWDDLLVLHNTQYWNEVVQLIKQALSEGNGLCAKWMPRKGHIAEALRIGMGMSPKQYRKTLVHLTKVVETQMCANKWTDINYSHVPSKAAQIYKNAFKRHDEKGYKTYLEGLVKGTTFEKAGYKAPILVFWNVNDHGNKPVTEQRENTVLVSGFSPSIMKTLLKADVESITPVAQMMETLMQERYNF